jgi:outer membrane receptor protein involved in Fe transport
MLCLAMLLALGLGMPGGAAGQDGPGRGRVLDGVTGAPVAGAVLRATGSGATALSGTDGRFRLTGAAAGEPLVAVAIGYAPDTLVLLPGLEVRLRPAPLALAPVVVAAAAPGGVLDDVLSGLDAAIRPRQSAQQLLELAPGLVTAQHAGGGKAEQIFLRGFDADHGTDVAVAVDGVPVNLVSHAHGQGYADLHFLLPELVDRVEVRRGGHDARDGNLATAGAVHLVTLDRVGAAAVRFRAGAFGTRDAMAVAPFGAGIDGAGGYVAAGRLATDGPFEASQGLRRHNAFARWTAPVGAARLSLTVSGHSARWDASGQVPERAVRAGRIGRFGAIDSTEGGSTARYDLWAGLASATDAAVAWRAQGWVTRYRMGLFSNFTFFRDDPDRGDGIEQAEDRTVLGAAASLAAPLPLGDRPGRFAAGIALRHDAVDALLARQVARQRGEVRAAAAIGEANAGAWLEHHAALSSRVGVRAGVRADLFRFRVRDRLGDAARVARAARVSPKLALTVDAGGGLLLVARGSQGFHSNDARQIFAGAPSLPVARTVEVAVRRVTPRWAAGVTGWRTTLESELVYVGDDGATEAAGRSLRAGLEMELRVRMAPWLWADADLSLARARLRDEPPGADRVPLAPSRVAAAGLTVRDAGPLSVALRVRHTGARPADEAGTVRAAGHTLADLGLEWRAGRLTLAAALENALDATWNEAQFATTSRLRGESMPITELHFTPGAPRRAQVSVRLEW